MWAARALKTRENGLSPTEATQESGNNEQKGVRFGQNRPRTFQKVNAALKSEKKCPQGELSAGAV